MGLPIFRRADRLACLLLLCGGAIQALGACGRTDDGRAARQRRSKAAAKKDPGAPVTARLGGSRATGPVRSRLVELLARERPPIRVEDRTMGARAALEALGRGELDIVVRAREPDEELMGRVLASARAPIRATVLGADVITVLAHYSNPTDRIDVASLGTVLKGSSRSWRDVRGADLPLIPFMPRGGPPALDRLRAMGVAPPTLSAWVRQVDDVATLLESLRRTPGGMALLARLRWPPPRDMRKIKVLAIARNAESVAYLPTDSKAIREGLYPLRLPLVLIARLPEEGAGPALRRVLRRRSGLRLGAPLGIGALSEQALAAARKPWLRIARKR